MTLLKQTQKAILVAGLFTSFAAGAQSGTAVKSTAVGLRIGETSGLTFKHFVDQSNAFEGILGVWSNTLGLTALYEKHIPAFDLEGMRWYFGGGGHIAFESRRDYYVYYYGDRNFYHYRMNGGMDWGIDGIIGLEYKIKAIPFAVSFDMKPFAEVNSYGEFYFSLDPGVGLKLTF